MTRDVEGAKSYYGDTCGWTFTTMPMEEGDYHLAMLNGQPVAGIMDMSGVDYMKDAPAHWMSYFAVDDVDAAVEATKAAGGKCTREPFDVPGTGRIAMLTDPTGAEMGLMTPEPMD
ncbi:VOC family protein [Cognatiyoonia koreensis]|nr:VOC family protein [Cognatiyoonia koreensis]